MKIVILEDDSAEADLVCELLKGAGHACTHLQSGEALVSALRRDTYDLLILDWNVPGASGLDVTVWARTHLRPTPPILVLTARNTDDDLVTALQAGADDFVVKPVEPRVLLARVEALLRRAYDGPARQGPAEIAGYHFDPLNLAVRWAEATVVLTDREFALALTFFRNLQRQLSRAYLLETIWGWSPDAQTRTLDAHVSRIRKKLDLRPPNGFRLAPVYSYGYRLERLDPDGQVSS
jgi:DNA-binding response OmpR family regulator